jgi:hypothetical protein
MLKIIFGYIIFLLLIPIGELEYRLALLWLIACIFIIFIGEKYSTKNLKASVRDEKIWSIIV